VAQHGFVGVFELVMANAATVTAFADLAIALSLVLVWMWQDAHQRGVSWLPYALVTLALGSVGPLLYLIVREGSERAPATKLATQPR
ncbi:MAG: DUF2834 domain-containing protein, partial [Candidatus Binatia bacterium]